MAWIRRQSETGNVDAYLVDGYLPRQERLELMADGVRSYVHIPISWDGHDADSVFERLAFGVRGAFCSRRPPGQRYSVWSEAWLLKPELWGPEYQLKTQDENHNSRRLLVTLYSGCAFGQKCARNLVTETRFRAIPMSRYEDTEAFRASAIELLDEVSLPFKAPCIIAGEKMQDLGYAFRSFGR